MFRPTETPCDLAPSVARLHHAGTTAGDDAASASTRAEATACEFCRFLFQDLCANQMLTQGPMA